MNANMLNTFLLFSRKRNELKFSQVGFITYLLILVKYGSIYRHFTNVVHGLYLTSTLVLFHNIVQQHMTSMAIVQQYLYNCSIHLYIILP